MIGPYSIVDCFRDMGRGEPLVCPDPENCTEHHNEADPNAGEEHHCGCECGWCQYVMWTLK